MAKVIKYFIAFLHKRRIQQKWKKQLVSNCFFHFCCIQKRLPFDDFHGIGDHVTGCAGPTADADDVVIAGI